MTQDAPSRRPGWSLVGYPAMIGTAAAAFFFIRHFGNGLSAPAPVDIPFGSPTVRNQFDAFSRVLVALVIVILAARVVGAAFAWLRQPPVVGEVLAGVLLGPSVLGRLAPGASAFVLPPEVAPFLSVLAQIGVILYMFLVGLELDLARLRKRTHAAVLISHASIIVPFILGTVLALLLYPRLATSDVSFTHFALFSGVSMSVTAFPVLARILTDRGVQTSPLGVIALACAAVDDVTAWCLLAFVVSVVNTHATGALATFALTLAYLAVMFGVLRPIVRRLVERQQGKEAKNGLASPPATRSVLAVVFIALLLSALATEFIGIHAIFGGFALGTIIPADSSLARDLQQKLEDFVVIVLLPAFFAFTGLRTSIGLVQGAEAWTLCGLILLTACAGKFGGSAIAARLTGLKWRDAASVGILMNTRGLMELIVLNIGLDLHVISPTLFAMLVIMALVTTTATTPILDLLSPFAPGALGAPVSRSPSLPRSTPSPPIA